MKTGSTFPVSSEKQTLKLITRPLPRAVVGVAFGAVEHQRDRVPNRTRGLGERPHRQQDARYVRMRNDRDRCLRLHAGGAGLPALARIGERRLRCALGDVDALQAGRKALALALTAWGSQAPAFKEGSQPKAAASDKIAPVG